MTAALTPQTFRPIPKTDAEKIVAAIAASAAAADGYDQRTAPDTIADGDNLMVVSVSVTPKKAGSRMHVTAVLNGTVAGPAVVKTSLSLVGTGVFGTGGQANTKNDASLAVIGKVDSGPVGTPMVFELYANPVGANLLLSSDAAQGVALMVEEVGGT